MERRMTGLKSRSRAKSPKKAAAKSMSKKSMVVRARPAKGSPDYEGLAKDAIKKFRKTLAYLAK